MHLTLSNSFLAPCSMGLTLATLEACYPRIDASLFANNNPTEEKKQNQLQKHTAHCTQTNTACILSLHTNTGSL